MKTAPPTSAISLAEYQGYAEEYYFTKARCSHRTHPQTNSIDNLYYSKHVRNAPISIPLLVSLSVSALYLGTPCAKLSLISLLLAPTTTTTCDQTLLVILPEWSTGILHSLQEALSPQVNSWPRSSLGTVGKQQQQGTNCTRVTVIRCEVHVQQQQYYQLQQQQHYQLQQKQQQQQHYQSQQQQHYQSQQQQHYQLQQQQQHYQLQQQQQHYQLQQPQQDYQLQQPQQDYQLQQQQHYQLQQCHTRLSPP
ncbi:hypothetical protein FHG87_021381 [Trinorchestia longiramus]|nr:hypothetical protein FHG87_021381 [Trinorchestia longiramus]